MWASLRRLVKVQHDSGLVQTYHGPWRLLVSGSTYVCLAVYKPRVRVAFCERLIPATPSPSDDSAHRVRQYRKFLFSTTRRSNGGAVILLPSPVIPPRPIANSQDVCPSQHRRCLVLHITTRASSAQPEFHEGGFNRSGQHLLSARQRRYSR